VKTREVAAVAVVVVVIMVAIMALILEAIMVVCDPKQCRIAAFSRLPSQSSSVESMSALHAQNRVQPECTTLAGVEESTPAHTPIPHP